jgi:ABC-type bacteriocin/lantibiotic exporter with double-glycine peptidase domain
VLFAAVMAMVNIGLAAVAVPIVLLNAVAVRLAARARGSAAQRLMKDRSQLSGNTVGLIRSIEGIKAGGAEQDTFARWAGYHAKTMASQRDFDRRTALIGMVPPLLAGIGSAALLGVGSLEVIAGRISVGDLVAFLALAAAFADPVTQIVGLSSTLQEVKAGASRVRDVLAYAPDPRFAPRAVEPQALPAERPSSSRLSGAIELRDITFGYNLQEPPLIEGFDLTVAPGMRLALVGASGSGKSTLGRLICGLHAPWSGAVLFDGVPAAEISRSVMANSLAYVDQDVFLFQGSVAENVALWDRSVGESEISRALKDAAIFEEIAVRPGRIGAPVLEGGGNFSGGQRQRLEIARALTNDPAILVLDEAMAALDPVVEQEIDDNIRRRGCTCIIIAHRLSTIRDCDEIIMLEGGRAIGRGRHEDLLATCPQYRRMIDAQ